MSRLRRKLYNGAALLNDRLPGRGTDQLVGARQLTPAERAEMGARCRDCDDLPRVADAGALITDDDGVRVQVMHNGLRVEAETYAETDLVVQLGGHHEPQEERVFYEIVERAGPDATMIELGAWWSFYSLWFLQGQPGRTAVALEPDPARRALGERNAARNGLAPRFVTGFAGGAATAPMPFTLDDRTKIDIPQHTPESLMRQHGIDTLDVLHCDAQGVELDVLRASAELLRSGRIRTVVVSTHHHVISGDPLTHQRCLALVQELGGHVLAEHDVHESFSGDGLVVARFGPDKDDWAPVPISLNRYSHSLFPNPLYEVFPWFGR